MPVDTTLRYRGHNSYQLAPAEFLVSDPYDVSLYEHITIQLAVIRTAGATSGLVGLNFFDADNKAMPGSYTPWDFSVPTRWEEIWKTIAVPENAKTMQWSATGYLHGYHIAVPKAGPGQFPSAFSDDSTRRESLLTAEGLYTSTVSANQVIAGVLLSLLGNAGFDLEKPEIWMDGKDGERWTASPDNPLKITDANNEFVGGLSRIATGLALIASAISNEEDPTVWMDVGSIADGGASYSNGMRLFHRAWSSKKGMLEIIPEGGVAMPTVFLKALEDVFTIRAVDNPGIHRASVIALLGSLMMYGYKNSDGATAAIYIDGSDTYSGGGSSPGGTQMGIQMTSPQIGNTTRKILMYAYNSSGQRVEIGIDKDGPYKLVGSTRTAL